MSSLKFKTITAILMGRSAPSIDAGMAIDERHMDQDTMKALYKDGALEPLTDEARSLVGLKVDLAEAEVPVAPVSAPRCPVSGFADMPVREAIAAIADIEDGEKLAELRRYEVAGKGRKMALEAIDARVKALAEAALLASEEK